MSKVFETFDVGFFDLIIADESHRSIYNRYRDIFLYFDALEVGLTATPIDYIARNTFTLFGCEKQDPTSNFTFNEAINHVPPYLVPFKVQRVTTAFQRDGIRYSQMNEDQVTVASLENVRTELRGIVRHRSQISTPRVPPKVIDVKEDEALIERRDYKPKLEGLDLAAYRKRVEQALSSLFTNNPTLQRIKAGQPVSEMDLKTLVSLVLTQYPDLDLTDLTEYFPETAGHLDMAIRTIIGLDAQTVDQVFQGFVRKHRLNSMQIRFLTLLQNHIARYGSIELERLYDAPFTSVHTEGLDGVFPENAQVDELMSLIKKFSPSGPKDSAIA